MDTFPKHLRFFIFDAPFEFHMPACYLQPLSRVPFFNLCSQLIIDRREAVYLLLIFEQHVERLLMCFVSRKQKIQHERGVVRQPLQPRRYMYLPVLASWQFSMICPRFLMDFPACLFAVKILKELFSETSKRR